MQKARYSTGPRPADHREDGLVFRPAEFYIRMRNAARKVSGYVAELTDAGGNTSEWGVHLEPSSDGKFIFRVVTHIPSGTSVGKVCESADNDPWFFTKDDNSVSEMVYKGAEMVARMKEHADRLVGEFDEIMNRKGSRK